MTGRSRFLPSKLNATLVQPPVSPRKPSQQRAKDINSGADSSDAFRSKERSIGVRKSKSLSKEELGAASDHSHGSHYDDRPNSSASHKQNSNDSAFASHLMLGLTMSGVASSLLTSVFSLFHVDLFLRVYELPLPLYSTGSFIFSIINTLNDLYGAWLVDNLAATYNRCNLIGFSGILFSLCFLTPFFRWEKSSSSWDLLHFIVSMSLYDTLFSFTAILMGSIVTDNHSMTDKDRVYFMASGKVANLCCSFVVVRFALAVFDDEGDDLRQFRYFLIALVTLVSMLFGFSHIIMKHGSVQVCLRDLPKRAQRKRKTKDDDESASLRMRHVVAEFWRRDNNFWAWIFSELLLESQVAFVGSFSKTFVDRLLFDGGEFSRNQCDWLLSIMRPLGLICGILCYLPIQRFGYRKVYLSLFLFNFGFSAAMATFFTYESTTAVAAFLLVYPAITGAVMSSGFHLVMSDMVLESKRRHIKEGRSDAVSLAGIYMGANALFCKPAESLLPILAAQMLSKVGISSPNVFHELHESDGSDDIQKVLYQLLIFPPLVFSIVQWLSWRRYNLTPQKTSQMRREMQKMESGSFDSMA